MADIGHNSGDEAAANLTAAARQKLKQVVASIETTEEEQRQLAELKRDKYAEAKALGYDTKALRAVIKFRKQDRQAREDHEAILQVYLMSIGELA